MTIWNWTILATMIAGGSMSMDNWKRLGFFLLALLVLNIFAPGIASWVLGAVILAALVANADRIAKAVGVGRR